MKFAIEHGSPADLSGFATPLRQLGLHHTLPFPKDGHWRCPCRSTESTWPPFWHFEPSTALWLWQSLHPESASICAIYLDTYIYHHGEQGPWGSINIHQPCFRWSFIKHPFSHRSMAARLQAQSNSSLVRCVMLLSTHKTCCWNTVRSGCKYVQPKTCVLYALLRVHTRELGLHKHTSPLSQGKHGSE